MQLRHAMFVASKGAQLLDLHRVECSKAITFLRLGCAHSVVHPKHAAAEMTVDHAVDMSAGTDTRRGVGANQLGKSYNQLRAERLVGGSVGRSTASLRR